MNSIATEQISTLKMSIYRYDPDTGNKPFMQEMDIDIPVSYTHLRAHET